MVMSLRLSIYLEQCKRVYEQSRGVQGVKQVKGTLETRRTRREPLSWVEQDPRGPREGKRSVRRGSLLRPQWIGQREVVVKPLSGVGEEKEREEDEEEGGSFRGQTELTALAEAIRQANCGPQADSTDKSSFPDKGHAKHSFKH